MLWDLFDYTECILAESFDLKYFFWESQANFTNIDTWQVYI